MKVAIVGAGYVGLVTAACLSEMGHTVTLLEISPGRVEDIRHGRTPFFEPGLDEIVREQVRRGALQPTEDPGVATADCVAVMVCVGTPLGADGEADLSQVETACVAIAGTGCTAAVVMRSTLPLGSTNCLLPWLGRSDPSSIVTNPEFLRQGCAVGDFMRPTRVVIGTHDGSATSPACQTVRDIYAPLDAPIIITNYASAEMIKNVANAFLATRLSFVNEVADLCEAYDADVRDVIRGIGLDPRIGRAYLQPGIGYGGSCLPKELANLVRLGQRRGLAMPLLEGVGRVNDLRPTRVVDRIEELCGRLRGMKVALLGLTFKPDTDDTRYSPSLSLVARLAERGANIFTHDPVAPESATAGLGVARTESAEEAIDGAHLVILATEWRLYHDLPWSELAKVAGKAVIFDGRNALDESIMGQHGWQVIGVGRGGSPSVNQVDKPTEA